MIDRNRQITDTIVARRQQIKRNFPRTYTTALSLHAASGKPCHQLLPHDIVFFPNDEKQIPDCYGIHPRDTTSGDMFSITGTIHTCASNTTNSSWIRKTTVCRILRIHNRFRWIPVYQPCRKTPFLRTRIQGKDCEAIQTPQIHRPGIEWGKREGPG